MRTDKERALGLRRQGKSYNEICQELGMSKSTLTMWFKGKDFSEAIKSHLSKEVYADSKRRLVELNRVRGISLAARYDQAREEAILELITFKNSPLFICALACYWGEGEKTSKHHVRITNTDPKMLRIFHEFLLKICRVPADRVRGQVFIYKDLNAEDCIKYWSEGTGVKHFTKATMLPSRHKTNRLRHGVCTIVVSSTYLKQKIMTWIDHLPELVLN